MPFGAGGGDRNTSLYLEVLRGTQAGTAFGGMRPKGWFGIPLYVLGTSSLSIGNGDLP